MKIFLSSLYLLLSINSIKIRNKELFVKDPTLEIDSMFDVYEEVPDSKFKDFSYYFYFKFIATSNAITNLNFVYDEFTKQLRTNHSISYPTSALNDFDEPTEKNETVSKWNLCAIKV